MRENRLHVVSVQEAVKIGDDYDIGSVDRFYTNIVSSNICPCFAPGTMRGQTGPEMT